MSSSNTKLIAKCTLTGINPKGVTVSPTPTALKRQIRNNPANNADVRAEITGISDNIITAKVIKLPNLNNWNNRNNLSPNTTPGNRPQGSFIPRPSGTPRPRPSVNFRQRPSGSPRIRPSRTPGQDSNIQRKVEYTGEVLIITVKSTVSIVKLTFANNNKTEKKISLKDLKIGNVINLWYLNSSKKEFSKIMINERGAN